MKKYILMYFLLYSFISFSQTLGLILNSEQSENGYTLFSPISSTKTYLINNQTQLDLSAGISLDDSQTKFLELGLAFRIPK